MSYHSISINIGRSTSYYSTSKYILQYKTPLSAQQCFPRPTDSRLGSISPDRRCPKRCHSAATPRFLGGGFLFSLLLIQTLLFQRLCSAKTQIEKQSKNAFKGFQEHFFRKSRLF